MQIDFLPGGALPVPDGHKIIPVINQVIPKFDLVVATQDWHPQDHMSFASNHPGHKVFEKIKLDHLEQTLWPDHCVQESPGAALYPLLNTKKVEATFRKGTDPSIDSYSAFYDNGHKKSTGLAGYLREKNAKDLYFCGLAGDICVFYSVMDAVKEGFTCYLITDASAPLNNLNYSGLQEILKKSGVTLVESKEI